VKHAEFAEELSIKFLLQFAAYPPTYLEPFEIGKLAQAVEINGITTPPVLSINPFTGKIRLDSGNHRVYILPCVGIISMPTVAYVCNTDVPSPSNGHHCYDTNLITYNKNDFTKPFYCKPSEVLRIE
jgi:hypothetical protein